MPTGNLRSPSPAAPWTFREWAFKTSARGNGINVGFQSRATELYYQEAEEVFLTLLPFSLSPFWMFCLSRPDGGGGPKTRFGTVWGRRVHGCRKPSIPGFSLRKTNLLLKLFKPGKQCSDGKFFPERSSTKFNHLKENMPQCWQREAGHVTAVQLRPQPRPSPPRQCWPPRAWNS